MKWTIYRKLAFGFGITILLMIIVNGYVLFELYGVTRTTESALSSDVKGVDLAKRLQTYLFDEERYANKYLITRDAEYYRAFVDEVTRIHLYTDSALATKPHAADSTLLSRIRDRHGRLAKHIEGELAVTARDGPARELTQQAKDSLDALHGALDQFIQQTQSSIARSAVTVNNSMVRSLNAAYLLTVVATFFALVIALYITRTINTPITQLIRGTDQIAHGRFDPIIVESNDEVGLLADAVNDMSSKLKQINDLKTELMHYISHEYRTPLQALLSAHYLLAEQRVGPLTEQQAKLLGSMRENINKLTRFTNQFLDISKIEAGMMEYRFEMTDLTPIVQREVENARLLATQKDISVLLTSLEVPPVMGEADKLSQVLSNLLSNGVKYTPAGGTVRLSIGPSAAGVRITVGDSGVGIAPEDIPRLFTKFYQAKSAGKSRSKGTGIGLALVKALVEAHKGTVSVQSTLGEGTAFTVELPSISQSDGRPENTSSIAVEGAIA